MKGETSHANHKQGGSVNGPGNNCAKERHSLAN